jgi:hypothetical protein
MQNSTASAVALLERIYAKVDELIGECSRLTGDALSERRTYASGKVPWQPGTPGM